jgi:DNA-directed RNA polymerase specialized sigma24 family protein
MSTDQVPQRAKSLTQEAFASFLLWLSPDHEQAAGKYLEIRLKLVKFFVRKGCAHAEDQSDETLDRAALIVHQDPTRYSNPIALCCGVARKVWLEYLRKVVPAPLEDNKIAAPTNYGAVSSEYEAICLDSCLEELSARDRDLITQYHQFKGSEKIETRKRLAEAHGGVNKLRITAYRIRVRLHECITNCVQRSAPN